MTIREGEVLLGRFRVEQELPPWGELARWSATDTQDGSPVELLSPARLAALRPGARRRFEEAHEGDGEGLLEVRGLGLHDNRPVAARAPAVAWGAPIPRLEDPEARALLAWLGPKVAAQGQRLGGRLGPEDLAWDAEGRPWLAPSGVVPEESLARPDRQRPPVPGGPAADALYGLGVWLFEALSGQPPATGRTARELKDHQGRPLSLSSLRPDLPQDLAELVGGLVSPDPGRRLAVLGSLPSASEPPIIPRQAASPEVALTPAQDPNQPVRRSTPVRISSRPDVPLPAWVVTTDAAALTGAARRRVAALAQVDERSLELAGQAGDRVALVGASSREEAEGRALALAPAGVDLSIEPSTRRWGPAVAAAGAGLLVAGLLGMVGLLGIFTVVLPLVATLLAVVSVVAGLGAGISLTAAEGRRVAPLQRHWGPLHEPTASPSGLLAKELRETRAAVLAAHLPELAQRDLLEVVDGLEARLSGPEAGPGEVAEVAELLANVVRATRAADQELALEVRQVQRRVALDQGEP